MKAYRVSTSALRHNAEVLRERTDAEIIAVLKGNGYGLGLVQYAKTLRELGFDFFAVADISEAVKLRENGFDAEILLLTPTSLDEEISALLRYGIIASVGSFEGAKKLNDAAKKEGIKARVHLKIDTGFGRYGFSPSEMAPLGQALGDWENLLVEGVFSHFSNAFAKSAKKTKQQLKNFLSCTEILEDMGYDLGIRHIANSCAFWRYPKTHLDAVRVGSAFLGRLPFPTPELCRVGELISRVAEVRTLPQGHTVGYADTYKTKRLTQIAVIPVGYKDGFGTERSRDTFRFSDFLRYFKQDIRLAFRHGFTVTINGEAAPVIGRIGMFHAVADVTGMSVKTGDEVVLPVNPLLVDSDLVRIYEE